MTVLHLMKDLKCRPLFAKYSLDLKNKSSSALSDFKCLVNALLESQKPAVLIFPAQSNQQTGFNNTDFYKGYSKVFKRAHGQGESQESHSYCLY